MSAANSFTVLISRGSQNGAVVSRCVPCETHNSIVTPSLRASSRCFPPILTRSCFFLHPFLLPLRSYLCVSTKSYGKQARSDTPGRYVSGDVCVRSAGEFRSGTPRYPFAGGPMGPPAISNRPRGESADVK